MDLTHHLKKGIFPWKEWQIQRRIRPYLKSTVGGHGRDAIFEMLNYVKKNFDGIIHLLPFGCMPETTVRPILEKIHQESGIPFLSLSLDEQVAEAGVDTRIEAFVDVIKNNHEHKKKQSISRH
jgi:predicted nucleotide-binding protein (sugar kinase/HSP70/actin superfamily)